MGVTKGLRSELAGAEARALRDPVEQPVNIPEPPLVASSGPRGHEEGAALFQPAAEHPSPQDGLHLRPHRDHPVRGTRLERTPAVGPNGDRLPVEGDVVELQPGDLPEPTPGQQEKGDQDVRVGSRWRRSCGRWWRAGVWERRSPNRPALRCIGGPGDTSILTPQRSTLLDRRCSRGVAYPCSPRAGLSSRARKAYGLFPNQLGATGGARSGR